MSPTPLKWRQPPAIRRAQGGAWRWLLDPGALLGLMAYGTVSNFVDGAILAVMLLALCAAAHRTPRYEISGEGIRYEDGYRRSRHAWSEIEWYDLRPHAAHPELVEIIFTTKSRKRTERAYVFVFDSNDIDQHTVQALLHHHLPQQDLQEWMQRNPGLVPV